MKKARKYISIILAAIIIILVITFITEKNKFNSANLDTFIDNYETYPENIDVGLLEMNISNEKNCFISNAYLLHDRDNSKKQIRFRYYNNNLFNEIDMHCATDFILKDSNGNDITQVIGVFSEEFWGFDGLNIMLTFKENTYMPKSGEKLFFTLGSDIDSNDVNKDNCFSYCELEILIP